MSRAACDADHPLAVGGDTTDALAASDQLVYAASEQRITLPSDPVELAKSSSLGGQIRGMDRYVALATAVLVSTSVFTWLAGPMLETQFGTAALIGAYAALAGAAGVLTYVLLRTRSSAGDESVTDSRTVEATIEIDEGDIDNEIQTLKEN